MQAALQGVLDAVLCARRTPWLHPESSPAWKQTVSPGPPGVRSAQPAGRMAQTTALPAQCCQPAIAWELWAQQTGAQLPPGLEWLRGGGAGGALL